MQMPSSSTGPARAGHPTGQLGRAEEQTFAAIRPARTRRTQLGWQDVGWLSLGVLFTLTISYVFGRGRIFWEDEMLGWMLLRDPSWHHMVQAWRLGADAGGFAFYLTGRAWFLLFGASEVSFRMYSGTGFAAAFVVLWVVLRRYYSAGTVAFALFNTFFFSPPLVLQMGEGRFYGLLMLSAALAVAVALWPEQPTRRGRYGLCGMAFLAHGLLTTSHLLGVVYSVLLLLAMLVIDRVRGGMRPLLYLSVAISWLLLLPERAAIFASMAAGKPHFWITQPNLLHVLGAYGAFSAEIAAVLALLGVALAGVFWLDGEQEVGRLQEGFRARLPVYCVTAALLLVPMAFYGEGLVGQPIFISRYLLPVVIAQAMLTAEALTLIPWGPLWTRMLPGRPMAGRAVQAMGLTCFAAAMVVWVFRGIRPQVVEHRNYTDAVSAMLPKGVPVLCEDAMSFTELIGRQHGSGVDYMYLLDWPESVRPAAPRGEVSEYHLMESWRRVGYFGGSIEDRDAFLRQHREFFVLHAGPAVGPDAHMVVGNPLLERFSMDPTYTVQRWASVRSGKLIEAAWLVCQGVCTTLKAHQPAQ